MAVWEAYNCIQNAVVVPGLVQDQLHEMRCQHSMRSLCTYTVEGPDLNYLKASHIRDVGIHNSVSESPFLFLPPADVRDTGEHKNKCS